MISTDYIIKSMSFIELKNLLMSQGKSLNIPINALNTLLDHPVFKSIKNKQIQHLISVLSEACAKKSKIKKCDNDDVQIVFEQKVV